MQPASGDVQHHMVASKVTRRNVPSSFRTGERSCPNTVPKLKFKKQRVCKQPQEGNDGLGLADPNVEPRLQSPRSEGKSLVGPSPWQVAEPEWQQQRESLRCSPEIVDPMRLELTLARLVPPTGPCMSSPHTSHVASIALRPQTGVLGHIEGPAVDTPTMEEVRFEEPPVSPRTTPVDASTDVVGLPEGADFINTMRGTSLGSMQTCVIPTSSGAFV
jgi:hypothetical protein